MCTSLSSAYVEAFLNSVPQNAGTPVPELTKTGFFHTRVFLVETDTPLSSVRQLKHFLLCAFFFLNTIHCRIENKTAQTSELKYKLYNHIVSVGSYISV